MELQLALDKLFSLHAFGIKLGLENTRKFLEHLGNPQLQLKAIHIAGSNGKGSTAAFTASILQEFNCKVGLYTSPHFVRFNERITINGQEISDKYIADFISKYEKEIDDLKLTFFEVTTAMAFKYFYESNIDYAVIETGLGGRLDATNVLDPLAVIITSISLEHTHVLGNTHEEIAKEKAAIIKKNSLVFTGKLPETAFHVIEDITRDLNCELFPIEEYTLEKHGTLELYTEEIELDDWSMPLKGDYQKYNAALAALAVTKILDTSDFNTVHLGIKNVIKNTGFQGRYEYFKKFPDIIFDSAHNPEGVENFLAEFNKDQKKYRKKVLLFGAMKDKSIKSMLTLLKNYFDEIHIAEINNERSAKLEDIIRIAEDIELKIIPEKNPIIFVEEFERSEPDCCLVVLGSMYLLGELKSSLQGKVA